MRRGLRTALCFAAALSGVVPAGARAQEASRTPESLTPVAGRLTDEIIARDLARLDALDVALRARATTEDAWAVYSLAKARAWQQVAYTEYTDNDRTGLTSFAFLEAHRLMAAFDARSWEEALETGAPEGSTRVRDDLWGRAESVRSDPWFVCGAVWVARAEVRLAWAGNEERTYNARDGRTHQDVAEELLDRAEAEAAACVLPPPPPQLPPAPDPEPEPEPEPEPVPTRYDLPNRVHFAAGTDTLSATTRSLLDEVAAVASADADVRVSVQGRVESLGDLAAQQARASGRVGAVVNYLVGRGVDRRAITVRSVVDRQALQFGGDLRRGRIRGRAWPQRDRARERRVDVRYTSSELTIIRAVPQEGDLQITGR